MPVGIYKHRPQQGFQKGHKDYYKKPYNLTNETRILISISNSGKKHTEESIQKRKDFMIMWWKDNKNGLVVIERNKKISNKMKSKPFKEEHRIKISCAMQGVDRDRWTGFISFEPYSIDWTRTLKRSIRERDKYTCKLCSNYGNRVHHIDYDKKNCNPDNLVCLCNSCHTKTNVNRKKWTHYLKNIIKGVKDG